jgi:anaerobic magnesium-protoporphyrin IX monomethyl ester cyclase
MKNLRIFLVNVGYRQPIFPLLTPPMGIMYLASYLRSIFKADVRLINQKLDNIANDTLVKRIVEFNPDVVGLGAITPTAQHLPYITKKIRSALPKTLILIGGPHVSAFGARTLETSEANAAVPGEGEVAVEQIIRSYFDGGSLEDVPGIHWKDEHGNIIKNPGNIPFIEDLDALPFPAYDLIDLPAYWNQQGMPPIPRRKYFSLFSSRGCPFNCIYCHNIFGKRFRRQSAERIVDEIEYLQKKYNANNVEFLDDIFNLDHKRLSRFCDLVHQRNLNIKIAFPNGVRTDIFQKDEIKALVEAGLNYSSYALESGSPRIQKFIQKNLDIEKYLANVETAASLGVFCYGFIMLGFPTETEADLQQTVDVVCRSKLHTASCFMVTPFPNTKLYKIVEETCPEKIAHLKYENMEYADVDVNVSEVSDDVLLSYQRKINQNFYLNPVRLYRILRDHPTPHLLPLYIPVFIKRVTRGLFSPSDSPG